MLVTQPQSFTSEKDTAAAVKRFPRVHTSPSERLMLIHMYGYSALFPAQLVSVT